MNTAERLGDPVVLTREATHGDKEQSQCGMYPNIIDVLVDLKVLFCKLL